MYLAAAHHKLITYKLITNLCRCCQPTQSKNKGTIAILYLPFWQQSCAHLPSIVHHLILILRLRLALMPVFSPPYRSNSFCTGWTCIIVVALLYIIIKTEEIMKTSEGQSRTFPCSPCSCVWWLPWHTFSCAWPLGSFVLSSFLERSLCFLQSMLQCKQHVQRCRPLKSGNLPGRLLPSFSLLLLQCHFLPPSLSQVQVCHSAFSFLNASKTHWELCFVLLREAIWNEKSRTGGCKDAMSCLNTMLLNNNNV